MQKKYLFFTLIFILLLTLCACSEANKLSFAEETISVYIDEEITPVVNIFPKKFSYELSILNETIAKVTDGGKIKGLKEGRTTLTAKSGKLTAECTLLVFDKNGYDSTDPIVKETKTVNFQIVNYKDYGLSSGALEPMVLVEGNFLAVGEPTVYGYYVDFWYLDVGCTQKFDTSTPITDNITLYAKISPRELAYNVVNGYIVGLLYKNLPHETLVLPSVSEGGAEIIGIADNAFMGDETIKEVTIPSSYLTVGTSAFAGCKSLEKVIFEDGAVLENVGSNAFGVCRDDDGKITTSCENLSEMNLPDTVETVGAFAFYKCAKLAIDFPTELTVIPAYAFSESGITSADLTNVNLIYEGAFKGCSALGEVTGTENVVKCEKYVFDGTKIAADASAKYNSDKKEPAFYADTILFGVHQSYGRLFGNGKYRIKEETTLIADNAFSGQNQSELTLYVDTEKANEAVNKYDFLGENLFYKKNGEYPTGIFVVVGEGLVSAYGNRYMSENNDYRTLFATAEIVEVAGNADTNNRGTHHLLIRNGSYYYDKYEPSEEGGARVIRVADLPTKHAFNITRINMNSFTDIKDLKYLHLNKVVSIAYMAVTNCPSLQYIYLTGNNLALTMPEDPVAIQFNGSIIVDDSAYNSYRQRWANAGFNMLYNKLKKLSEV